MKALLWLLVPLPLAWAQLSCEALLAAIESAFGEAQEVIVATEVHQGRRELAYSRVRLYKQGELWQSEVLEQRGLRPPGGQQEQGEPQFTLGCSEHRLSATPQGWRLELASSDQAPVERWELEFTRQQGRIVPLAIAGAFETRFLLLPIRGNFRTTFSWRF